MVRKSVRRYESGRHDNEPALLTRALVAGLSAESPPTTPSHVMVAEQCTAARAGPSCGSFEAAGFTSRAAFDNHGSNHRSPSSTAGADRRSSEVVSVSSATGSEAVMDTSLAISPEMASDSPDDAESDEDEELERLQVLLPFGLRKREQDAAVL